MPVIEIAVDGTVSQLQVAFVQEHNMTYPVQSPNLSSRRLLRQYAGYCRTRWSSQDAQGHVRAATPMVNALRLFKFPLNTMYR